MCGIAGFVGQGDEKTLWKMTEVLSRRGPDDKGVFLQNKIGLAHTRLAIVDLSPLGHQPMTSSSGKTVIVFNGEIYNFKELRKEIEAKGKYRFQSHSDTEVILALYEEYGERAFQMINGMFAIALYDLVSEKVYLVRDRLGKKPLYYGILEGTLVFGSEIKALMCHGSWKSEIDKEALNMYLTYEYVPTPYSIFKDIKKLEPGSLLVYKNGSIEKKVQFWKPEVQEFTGTFKEAVLELDKLLEQTVSERMVADVPVGVFLSGGIDSSTVAYYAQKGRVESVKTFSISFDDPSFDESSYAEAVAKHIGTEHHTEYFSIGECIDVIPKVFEYLDEPMADPSILPTYLLSEVTRKKVTVALGGDGADELFLGYGTFEAERFVRIYTMIPRFIRKLLINPFVRMMPVSHAYMSSDFKAKKFIEGADAKQEYRHQHWLGAFTEENTILRSEWRLPLTHSYSLLDTYFKTFKEASFFTKLQYAYLMTYLMDEVMVKVDRVSMANSLEVRSPFLDYTLVNFALSLPQEFKIKGRETKYILRKLMEDKLPKDIVERKKKGFGVPIGKWLQNELKPLAEKLLSKENLDRVRIFDFEEAQRLLEDHQSGKADNRKKLWTLMAFLMWYDAFVSKN